MVDSSEWHAQAQTAGPAADLDWGAIIFCCSKKKWARCMKLQTSTPTVSRIRFTLSCVNFIKLYVVYLCYKLGQDIVIALLIVPQLFD